VITTYLTALQSFDLAPDCSD